MLELIRQSNSTERRTFAIDVIAVAVNIALPLAYPDGAFAFLNWFTAGFCTSLAAARIFRIRTRLVLATQNAIIKEGNALIATLVANKRDEPPNC